MELYRNCKLYQNSIITLAGAFEAGNPSQKKTKTNTLKEMKTIVVDNRKKT